MRELSKDALLHELEAFLSYQAKGGPLSLVEWAATKDFAPGDRTFLEVAYMGATVAQRLAS